MNRKMMPTCWLVILTALLFIGYVVPVQSSGDVVLDIAPIKQIFQPPEPIPNTTLSDFGEMDCNPASTSMALQYFSAKGRIPAEIATDYPTVRRFFRGNQEKGKETNLGLPTNMPDQVIPTLTNEIITARTLQTSREQWLEAVRDNLNRDLPILAHVMNWRLLDGEKNFSSEKAHTILIVGLRDGNIHYNDPWTGNCHVMSIESFEKAWNFEKDGFKYLGTFFEIEPDSKFFRLVKQSFVGKTVQVISTTPVVETPSALWKVIKGSFEGKQVATVVDGNTVPASQQLKPALIPASAPAAPPVQTSAQNKRIWASNVWFANDRWRNEKTTDQERQQSAEQLRKLTNITRKTQYIINFDKALYSHDRLQIWWSNDYEKWILHIDADGVMPDSKRGPPDNYEQSKNKFLKITGIAYSWLLIQGVDPTQIIIEPYHWRHTVLGWEWLSDDRSTSTHVAYIEAIRIAYDKMQTYETAKKMGKVLVANEVNYKGIPAYMVYLGLVNKDGSISHDYGYVIDRVTGDLLNDNLVNGVIFSPH